MLNSSEVQMPREDQGGYRFNCDCVIGFPEWLYPRSKM